MAKHSELSKSVMTRRQLLSATVSFAAASMSGYAAADISDPVILGRKGRRYLWMPDWLKPPENIKWGDTHGVAQDARGRIYISHTVRPSSLSRDAIVVFDWKGKFLASWGSEFDGGGHGLDIRREGGREYLYHCDIAHRIFAKTDLEGSIIWQKGAPEEAGVYKNGSPFIPTNIALTAHGDFYVADGYGSNWIHQYDIKGDYIRTFGGTGTDPGKFQTPHGIWVDNRGHVPELAVADRSNHRLQYLTMDGKYIRTITNGMRQPCHFHIRGEEMMVPDLDSVVTILDKENRVVLQLGDGYPSHVNENVRQDFLPGKFIHPHSAKYLHNGDILVVEWVPIGRVTLLKKLPG